MSHTFVVGTDYNSNNNCKAILGYRNDLANENTEVVTTSEDANYPIEFAYDYKTNTEYSPALTSGTVTITISQDTPTLINYVGLFCKNAKDCNLSFEVEVYNTVTSSFVEIGSRENFANAKPQMIYFDPIMSTQQKIILTFTAKCFIAALYVGEAIEFTRPPSLGYQPGRNASIDEVMNFKTEGNNFIQGRRLTNGFQEKADIRYQSYIAIDNWWIEFMNHVLDSKALFFMAHQQKQENCIFGLQDVDELSKPFYSTSHHTDIRLTIVGFA